MAVTPTYVPLATATLASGATSVTFSSIPATYRDLVVVVNGGRNAGSDAVYLRLNSDTGANYSWVTMWGNGSSPFSQTQGSINTYVPMGFGANLSTSFDFASIAQVMDYSATDKHKTVLVRSNRASSAVEAIAGRWANTNAVNTLTVANFGSTIAGTTVSVYGIA